MGGGRGVGNSYPRNARPPTGRDERARAEGPSPWTRHAPPARGLYSLYASIRVFGLLADQSSIALVLCSQITLRLGVRASAISFLCFESNGNAGMPPVSCVSRAVSYFIGIGINKTWCHQRHRYTEHRTKHRVDRSLDFEKDELSLVSASALETCAL